MNSSIEINTPSSTLNVVGSFNTTSSGGSLVVDEDRDMMVDGEMIKMLKKKSLIKRVCPDNVGRWEIK